MKKTILIIAALLFAAATCYAASVTKMYQMVVAAKNGGGGGGCSGTFGEVTGASADSYNYGPLGIMLIRVALDCGGGTIDEINGYTMFTAGGAANEMMFVVYADNGSGTDPAGLLWYSPSPLQMPVSTEYDWQWINETGVNEALVGDPAYIWVGGFYESAAAYISWIDDGTPSRLITGLSDFTTGSIPETWPTGTDSAGTLGFGFNVVFN